MSVINVVYVRMGNQQLVRVRKKIAMVLGPKKKGFNKGRAIGRFLDLWVGRHGCRGVRHRSSLHDVTVGSACRFLGTSFSGMQRYD
jgi:hypothetical protein